MLNKKQLNFLKYVSKPRNRSDVIKKYPKCRENGCIYELNFSQYFDKCPGDMLKINDAGIRELKRHPIAANLERIILLICAIIGAVCAILALL